MINRTMQIIILIHVYITEEVCSLNSNGFKTIFRHLDICILLNVHKNYTSTMCITNIKLTQHC